MNILSYVVTFPATTARKTFFGTPTGPTQTSLLIYVNSRSLKLEQNKKTISFTAVKNELLAWEYKPYASSILKI